MAGWPGARLTALLTVAAAPEPRTAWRVWRRDGSAHPSPNAGQAESAFAGALGVRLGGTLTYGERVEHRPVLGAELRAVSVDDIERACTLSRRVGMLALVVTALAGFVRTCGAVPSVSRAQFVSRASRPWLWLTDCTGKRNV